MQFTRTDILVLEQYLKSKRVRLVISDINKNDVICVVRCIVKRMNVKAQEFGTTQDDLLLI